MIIKFNAFFLFLEFYDSCFAIFIVFWFVYTITICVFIVIFECIENSGYGALFNLKYLNEDVLLLLFFIVAILSVTGIPPLLGFWTKVLIILYIVESSTYIISLFFILLLISILFYLEQLITFFNDLDSEIGVVTFEVTGVQFNILFSCSCCLIFGFIWFDELFILFSVL